MEKEKKDRIVTPYDDVFKSVAHKCPRLLLPLINEMFFKNGLIDSLYDGTQEIELLNTEIPSLNKANLDMDLLFLVKDGNQKDFFHLECQSTIDPSMDERLFEYVVGAVQKEVPLQKDEPLNVYFPNAGVLSLRSTKNTKAYFSVNLMNRSFKTNGPMIFPNLKLRDYSLTSIREKRLFFLLPFLMFNYEKELEKKEAYGDSRKSNSLNTESYKILEDTYYNILQTLEASLESEDLTYFEMHTLYDATKAVFQALAKKNDVMEEVNEIMAGKILEFTADKSYYAGEKNGEKNGMEKLNEIIQGLHLEEDNAAIMRLIRDEAFREEMYKKYKNNAS